MDKEQARFILGSFRPGIDEVDDSDFTQALALAATNRELGEWLSKERAMDEAFAIALCGIPLPETLREDIIGCLHGDRHGLPEADSDHDARMIGALASVRVPSSLRQQILSAMERSSEVPDRVTARAEHSRWRRWSMPLAAAAGVAFAMILTHQPDQRSIARSSSKLPLQVVQAGFIDTYKSPFFHLDVKKDKPEALVEELKSRSLPCPCCLPPGLNGVKSIGCREMEINGKHGSLICFEQDDVGIVHLVIFRRDDIDGQCSDIKDPCTERMGEWSVARWQNSENIFILIGKTTPETLKKLF